jgi:hypothetical protein
MADTPFSSITNPLAKIMIANMPASQSIQPIGSITILSLKLF